MHEFALAEDLLKLSGDEARKAGIKRLEKVVVRIGDLSGISADALEFAFGFLKEEDEVTREAELVIQRSEGRGRCRNCGREVSLDRLMLYCPDCATPTVEITQGREFLIVTLEGEDEADDG